MISHSYNRAIVQLAPYYQANKLLFNSYSTIILVYTIKHTMSGYVIIGIDLTKLCRDIKRTSGKSCGTLALTEYRTIFYKKTQNGHDLTD